jgi:hypothetical protein
MNVFEDRVIFRLTKLLKHSRAAEVEADLVLCALKIEVSIPAKRNTVLIHLAMVSVETL